MSPVKAEHTHGVTQVATPTYRLSDDLLDRVQAALPPMVANAPLAWQRTRRKWIIKEIAALHPADALQAVLAGQIVMLRHLAASLMGRAGLRTTSLAQARLLGRTAAALAGTGQQLERELRRRRKNAVPPGRAGATDGCDLASMDALWRSNSIQRENAPAAGEES